MKSKQNDTKKMMVPELRFGDFDGAWCQYELEKLTTKISVGIATEVRPYISTKEEVPLLRNQNIKGGYFDDSSMEYILPVFDESNKTKRVQSNDVIIVRTGSNMGNACVVPDRFRGSQTFTTLIVRPSPNDLHSSFLSYHINYLGLSEIKRLSAGGGKPNLNSGFLKKYRIYVGGKDEQKKIVSFLSTVDERIQQLTKKKELLEQYKKGVMQQLFSGQLRFKDEKGNNFPDWEWKRIGELFESRSETGFNNMELLSISISKGVYSQSESNKKDNSNSDKSKYKRVLVGDIAYNSMRMWQGASAVSKLDGIVSPAYTILKRNDQNSSIYYGYLFKMSKMIQTFQKHSQGLTSDTWNLKYPMISRIKVLRPSNREQQKIATYLSSIDTKIENVNQQITQTQTFKKGLLQQMFV